MQVFLGLDVGTSACRAAVFTAEGRCLSQAAAPCRVRYAAGGVAEQDATEWYEALCLAIPKALAEAGAEPGEIAGIGVDGQSWAAVCLDAEGNPVCPAPIWLDTRSDEVLRDVRQTLGKELFELSGNPLMPGYCTGKLLWLRRERPELYRRVRMVLQSNAYVVYRLTGCFSHDLSQGYGLHCFDMRRGVWDKGAAERLGIAPELLPPLFPCHAVVGGVTPQAAGETGLRMGIPVVAGGLDAACGTLGAGVLRPGQVQEQGGQAGGMSVCVGECRAHEKLILSRHVVPGLWLLQGGSVGGGGVLKWFEREFGLPERGNDGSPDFQALDRLAESSPPGANGVVFLPYMAGERSPVWDGRAKGVFYGLSYRTTRADMLRAVMESVGYSLRQNFETAREAGAEVNDVYPMGGSANSRFWTQMKADITGYTLKVPATDSATTHGAAMLAMLGTGAVPSFEKAAENIHITREHHPEPKPAYEQAYRIYTELYPALREIMDSRG